MQRVDYEAWLFGLYNYTAHCVALGNSFGGGKNDYPQKPYSQSEKEETSAKDHAERFKAFAEMFNSNFRKQHGED